MGGTLTAGILAGYVFVVPGLGIVVISGLLNVPLGTMLIYGILVGPSTAVITTFIYSRVLKYGLWNEAKDEAPLKKVQEGNTAATEEAREGSPAERERQAGHNSPPLYVSLMPILVALLLIGFGAVAEAASLESPVIAFLGDPVFALFLGLLGAYMLAWRTLSKEQVGEAMYKGFNESGQILLMTGLGGFFGSGDWRDRTWQNPWGIFLARGGHAGSVNDSTSLVDCGRFAHCHRFDLGCCHHRSRHTGPNIG
jgi:gluconate:H+ symporter, GntP family